jgi:CheY-like chemotaxis protein
MTALALGSPRFSSERAEGTLPADNAHEGAASPVTTMIVPAVRVSTENGAPAAETGMVAAVVLPTREGIDNNDAQDAARRTDEMKTVPAADSATRKHAPAVLIIEDSAELAEIIEVTLQRFDLVTAHESHGNKALTRFHSMKPDVVLLDIGLPDMTGWKLLDDIKERYGSDKLPAIVVITAYGDPANRLVGKLQNVHDYLIKPFTADDVERVVMSALGSAAS